MGNARPQAFYHISQNSLSRSAPELQRSRVNVICRRCFHAMMYLPATNLRRHTRQTSRRQEFVRSIYRRRHTSRHAVEYISCLTVACRALIYDHKLNRNAKITAEVFVNRLTASVSRPGTEISTVTGCGTKSQNNNGRLAVTECGSPNSYGAFYRPDIYNLKFVVLHMTFNRPFVELITK